MRITNVSQSRAQNVMPKISKRVVKLETLNLKLFFQVTEPKNARWDNVKLK